MTLILCPPVAELLRPPLATRSLPAIKARAANALAVRAAPFALKAGGGQVAAAVIGPIPVQPDAPWIALTLDGHPAWAQLSHGLARRLAGVSLETAPGAEAALLLEEALSPWLDEIEDQTGLSLRFLALTDAPPQGGLERGWAVQGTLPGKPALRQAGALCLSLNAAERLGRALAGRARARDDLPGLSLRLSAERDGARLTLAEVRSLQPGDALVLPGDDTGDEIHGRLVLEGSLCAPALRDGAGGWRLTGPFRPQPVPPRTDQRPETTRGPDMTTDPSGPALPRPDPAEPAISDLDALELRLSFRLGETLVPISDLRTLAPGAVVMLAQPEGALVDILANGRKIGTGEVISVAGQRAVEIRSLFADG